MDITNFYINKYLESCSELKTPKKESFAILKTYFKLIENLDSDLRKNIGLLFNSLPYNPTEITLSVVLNSLAQVGYLHERKKVKLSSLKKLKMPAFVEINNKYELMIVDANENIEIYNPQKNTFSYLKFEKNHMVSILKIYKMTDEDDDLSYESCKFNSISWFHALALRYKNIFNQFMLITILLHIISMASPIYLMLVYDKVINVHQSDAIIPLTIGIIIVICFEQILKYCRSMAISNISSRIDYIVNTSVVEKLMSLSPSMIESSSIVSQIARLKSFSSIREFFSGPIFISSVEIPFTIIMLLAIAVINVKLTIIPIFAIIIFVLIMFLSYNSSKAQINKSAECNTKKINDLNDFIERIHETRYSGLASHYKIGLKKISNKAAFHEYKSLVITSLIDAIGRSISLLTALGTLILGATLVMNGELSVGGMIASIFLLWRVLAPLQNFASSMSRLEKLRKSIKQINSFMNINPEQRIIENKVTLTQVKGDIKFTNVVFKHEEHSKLMLKNLSLHIPSEKLTVITGKSGSGKTTILKLINGTLNPNLGEIIFDNVSLRQMDLNYLRQNITYIAQHPTIVTGSIIDNVRNCSPFISEKKIIEALYQTNAHSEIELLEKNYETLIAPDKTQMIPKSLIYKLNLARLYVSKAPILLIDYIPNMVMNDLCGENLIKNLMAWKGSKTIILVSYRQDIINMADCVIDMNKLDA